MLGTRKHDFGLIVSVRKSLAPPSEKERSVTAGAQPSHRNETLAKEAPRDSRLAELVAAAALVGAVALLLSLPLITPLQADSYMVLYVGRWIAHHGLPHTEALTVMASGHRWIDQQWLAELIFYSAWKIGGYGLVALVALVAISLAYAILATVMTRRGASVGLVLLCAIVAILTLTGWQFVRSQDLALPLFAAVLAVCVTDAAHEQPGRRLLLLVPILALWANLHGSVLLGAALATGYLLFRAVATGMRGPRRSAAACAALGLATALTPLATPYGTQITDYYSAFVGNGPMAKLAVAWAPPRFPSFVFFELCVPAAFVMLALVFASIKRRRPSTALLGAAGLTGAAAALKSGSIVWFGMAAALLLAEIGTAWWPARARAPRVAPALMIATAVALSALVVTTVARRTDASYESLLPARVLTAASGYAASHPCGLILADNLSSSALLWRDPSLDGRIAFDARLEQYSFAGLSRWLEFKSARPPRWTSTTSGFRLLVAESPYAPALVRRLDKFPPASVLARQVNGIAVLNGPAASAGPPCSRTTIGQTPATG
jgi:hypothetical protein